MFRFLAQAFWLQDLLARIIALVPSVGIHNVGKYVALKKAFYLAGLEGVDGDYLEFGVFTGSSMTAAIRLSASRPLTQAAPVRFFGFDSFEGFGEAAGSEADHPFYRDQNFQADFARVERRLKRAAAAPGRVTLVKGYFSETLAAHRPADYGIVKAAVVLVDCDTMTAARDALDFTLPALQEGTILILDDYFAYRGRADQGVYGAFSAFCRAHPEWVFRRVFDYGMGGVAMIASRA